MSVVLSLAPESLNRRTHLSLDLLPSVLAAPYLQNSKRVFHDLRWRSGDHRWVNGSLVGVGCQMWRMAAVGCEWLRGGDSERGKVSKTGEGWGKAREVRLRSTLGPIRC